MKKIICIIAVAVVLLALIICGVVHLVSVRNEKREQQIFQEAIAAYRTEKNKTYQQENARYDDYEVDVAFIGDSLTDGYDVAAYYPQFLVTNRGIGGDTTFDLEGRLQTAVYDLKPKVVVMLIGGNNLDTMFENYENILKGLQTNLPESRVVLLSLTSMGQDWAKGNETAAYNNVRIKMLAEQYGYAYVDLYSPLMDLSTGQIYPQYTTDGGHLTQEGYEVLTRQITPVLEELLLKKEDTSCESYS